MLQVAYLCPRQALPCGDISPQNVRVEHDQVEDEEDEEAGQDACNVAEHFLSIFNNQAQAQEDHDCEQT